MTVRSGSSGLRPTSHTNPSSRWPSPGGSSISSRAICLRSSRPQSLRLARGFEVRGQAGNRAILHSRFAIREYRMSQPALRPQDVVVLAKLLAYGGSRPSMAEVAADLSISASEVHAALKRLERARLL